MLYTGPIQHFAYQQSLQEGKLSWGNSSDLQPGL